CVERRARVGEQPRRAEHVVDDERLEDVELEVAGGAADPHRHVVAHHLGAHHRERLALGRVDLARHDGGAALVLRAAQLAEAGASQRTSLAILVSATARVRRAPCAETRPSWDASASNLLAAETKGRPVSSAIARAARAPKSGGALRPVPTAVPPSASS